jgi:hypothetical protein
MSSFADDLVYRLVADRVAQAAVNLFVSTIAAAPKGSAPHILIIETGGSGSDRTQNAAGDAYENPSAQILTRGKDYIAVRAMSDAAYDSLVRVRNTTLNGTWYVEIRGLQKFIDLGLDENANVRVAFNVLATKRP